MMSPQTYSFPIEGVILRNTLGGFRAAAGDQLQLLDDVHLDQLAEALVILLMLVALETETRQREVH